MSGRVPTVAVIYHFFAYYREPIIERLARSKVARFVFIADDHDYEHDLKGGEFSSAVELRPAPTRRLRRSFMWQRGIIGAAAGREFDQLIMLANPYWLATWMAAIIARLRGKRVLFWSHGFLKPPIGLKGFLRNEFLKLAHAHLFYGDRAKIHAVAAGWDPRRVHVVRNSLHLDAQTRARESVTAVAIDALKRQLFKDPSRPVVYCTCRLLPGKRLDLLLDAVAALASEGLRVNTIIVGDGPCKPDLMKTAHDAGLDVHFEGACYDEARIALLTSAADLTVCPGFVGLTAIHSMVFGVPVISNDRSYETAPEVEAIDPGVTGDLFRSGDVADLTRVMRAWLAGSHDRAATRRACIAMVEQGWSPAYQQAIIEMAVRGEPAHVPDSLPPA